MSLVRVLEVICPVHGNVTRETWWVYWDLDSHGAAPPFDQYGWNGRADVDGIRRKPDLRHRPDCPETLMWRTEPDKVPA